MSQESPQIDPWENIENISEYKTPDSPRKEIAENTQDLAEQILSATHSRQSANLSSPVTSSPLKESEEDVFDNFVQSPSVRDRVKSFEKRFINRADHSRVQTRSVTGGLLSPNSKRTQFFSVSTPFDLIKRKMANIGRAPSQKRSREDLRADNLDETLLSSLESKRARQVDVDLDSSYIDPALVQNFPEMTLSELQALQALEPDTQAETLGAVGGAPQQQIVYADVHPRPRLIPASSRESSAAPVEVEHLQKNLILS
jgi:hypothetical protein